MKKQIWIAALILALSLSFILLALWGLQVRDKLRAKTTTTRMKMLMGVLKSEQPERVDLNSLAIVAKKYNRAECLRDGWGRALVIDKSGGLYRIVSLGRDGKRGSCCEKSVYGDWDSDAVLVDDLWLQVW